MSRNLTGQSVFEMYMDKNTAIQYANKVPQSDTEQLAWFAASAAVGIKSTTAGIYLGFIGVTNSIQRGRIQSDVRALTDKNKKVKVVAYVTPMILQLVTQ